MAGGTLPAPLGRAVRRIANRMVFESAEAFSQTVGRWKVSLP
jgi:hypothetical protein